MFRRMTILAITTFVSAVPLAHVNARVYLGIDIPGLLQADHKGDYDAIYARADILCGMANQTLNAS